MVKSPWLLMINVSAPRSYDAAFNCGTLRVANEFL